MSEYNLNAPVKRFIAGAVCPACEAMDTIQMWDEDGTPNRQCVACGYADTLDARGNSVPKELPTRVNTSALKPKAADPKVQTVQFFPNPKLKKPE
ncbi:putative YheV family metal-binding protein [Pseudomonas sp. OF001]|jgi:uncharacterized metal-binding protein (TIGR02443 family)|uniref:YheV family putative zinc ribbon protein n=1 Tax=unclassified Pseudomonas TaxID=196821 RepID=UPI0010A5D3D4|nr:MULTISPECIES: YheV family putative zinc ribbon protein [unclassified Pseudomonas]THG77591.1 YheV family putative metal-binding protein [Pseudomonas sp. A-1]WPP44471.1 YheV family putative zinc ribbon protein [Pseudomonas sp. AN-1]CAD5376206.1 putative YheV family metal-binding protein [Pseudomonas sp. OF001]